MHTVVVVGTDLGRVLDFGLCIRPKAYCTWFVETDKPLERAAKEAQQPDTLVVLCLDEAPPPEWHPAGRGRVVLALLDAASGDVRLLAPEGARAAVPSRESWVPVARLSTRPSRGRCDIAALPGRRWK